MKPIRILFFLFLTTLMVSCEPQEEAQTERENPSQPLKVPTSGNKRLETPEQARAKQEKKEETFKKECESTDIYLVRNMSLFPMHAKGSSKVNGMELSFNLYNASSLVTFENIQLEVKFLSGSGRVVKKEKFTFNEPLKPSKSAIHKVETPISQQDYNAFEATEITLLGADCKQ